jgi:ferredoxin
LITGLTEQGPDGQARARALAGLQLAEITPASVVEFVSQGRCVVIGAEADALGLAQALGTDLQCVALVPGDRAPEVDQAAGTLVVRGGTPVIHGALGDFSIDLVGQGFNVALGTLLDPAFGRFDLVVDLGTPPRLQHAMLPLGYYAPGPDADARAALLEILPAMRGAFEKPKYFNYEPEICAHGRSGKRGCTRCIDACPAQAIVSIGEKVQVNPYLCQGGGACAMACPSGAMTYAYPTAGDLLAAMRGLLGAYRGAGGTSPCVLFHDASSAEALGADLVAALPERILPVAIEEIGAVGMDTWLACLAYGAEAVVLLTCDGTPPQVIEALQEQLTIARAILGGMGYAEDRLHLLNADQAVAARGALSSLPAGQAQPAATFVAPQADKRGTLRLALRHLQSSAPAAKRITPLPAGAPFGEVRVDAGACTLCMSCVSACPTHALQDGRGLPQLNFREWNCVQCGLCERTCPEDAIVLTARFLHDQELRERPRVLHEEQPVCCIACGKPFATRAMLEKLSQKLEGHWMFQTDAARRRLQMCEDCRVRDVFAAEARKDR